MTSTKRRPTRKILLGRPLCERLESRFVLSTVIGTDPGPGMVLSNAPSAFHVTFDSPIDPFSLGAGDVLVDQVAADGSLTPLLINGLYPQESLDDTGTVLTLDAGSPIAPGHYRLVLPGNTSLAGLDGSSPANADGSDDPLGDFTVVRPGIGLSSAIPLGAIGSVPSTVAGSLDLATNPSDVKLYQITLPNGHFYRLGAEVTAERDGSPLNAALALFDSQGNAISTDDVGRPDAPNDPFLYAGLKPGTYYLGVSGAGNLPGLPGGYNLQTQTPGSGQSGPGGPFTLHLVADAADLPGALINFSVQHADPLDPTPTGFTLQFSSPLDLGNSGSSVFDRATSGVDLVDQNGRTWPVTAANYDAQHAALQYVVADHLPQGIYTIRLDAAHPLVDLAGLSPTSPTMPKGVLATFAVGPDLRQRRANGTLPIPASVLGSAGAVASSEDLGPLSPDTALSGVSRTVTVQPGQTVAFRFVSLYDDYYKLGIQHVGGPVQVSIDGGVGERYTIDPGPSGQQNTTLAHLQLGPQLLRFTATGNTLVTITVRIGIGTFAWDSILANGLGQGPALNLRLVSSDVPANFGVGDSTAASVPVNSSANPAGPFAGPFALLSGATTATPPTPAHVGSSPSGPSGTSVATHGSTGLATDLGGTLVGRPSADADHIAAVGPGISADAIAMASAGPGLGQSLAAMGSLRGSFAALDQSNPRRADEPADGAPITDGSMPREVLPAPGSPSVDEPILAARSEIAATVASSTTQAEGIDARATDGALLATSAEHSETEDAEAPAGITAWIIGLVGMTAVGARWYQKRKRRAAPPAITVRAIPAPHKARTRVRV